MTLGLAGLLAMGLVSCKREVGDGSPLIDSVEPSMGTREGGTKVTLRGANLGRTKTVLFGASAARNVKVLDDSTIEAETPSQAPGRVNVVALSDNGRVGTSALAFVFSEFVSPQIGPITGGTLVTILGTNFHATSQVLFGRNAALDVRVLHPTILTCVTPPGAEATAVNVQVRGSGTNVITYANAFEYSTSVAGDGGPRVVSAISTSNTTLRVSFSEAVDNSANDPSNYSVIQANVNPESGVLLVRAAALAPDRMSVVLTTASQNELYYEVIVTNVKDLAGNMLASPELLVDPTRARFAGTPPPGGGIDTDSDGVPDNVEMNGWAVTVRLSNGQVESRTVTSDPTLADTDADRLTDAEERAIVIDPRNNDTDGDGIDDYAEWNEWYSDPFDQDTDKDGFSDSLELGTFATSSTIADTDGDQMTDSDEILRRNRNPLVADLPVPQITVDAVRLDVKITSSFTDEQGVVTGVQDTTSTSLTQSRALTTGRSTTESMQTENESSQKLGFEFGWGGTQAGLVGKVFGEAGFSQKIARGFTSTATQESAVASQQEYQASIAHALEESERRSVTRNIDEAVIQATVNLANQSDIAFTVKNLELSVLQQDRHNGTSFRPIATLRASGAVDPAYNLGPFDPERGPIIFENVEIFPNLVDGLMREPTGLVFKVVNYDVLDEFGRNFAFASQEVNDRTAGITVDYGNGTVERYRVATNAKYSLQGQPLGITMQRAMEIAGLTRAAGQDAPFPVVDPLPVTIRKTYGTKSDSTGTERLSRVRGVQNDFTGPAKRFWAVVTNNLEIAANANFSTIQVNAGDDYTLLYTRDVDQDGLFEREEYLYGSSDTAVDSDGDTLGDFFEVRTGWLVSKSPGVPYRVFSSPARADSDQDGLRDDVERTEGTDPNRADTDEDGLLDAQELQGSLEVVLFDGDLNDDNNQRLTLTPYLDPTEAIVSGPDGLVNTTRLVTSDDVQIILPGVGAAPGAVVIRPGPNGRIDTTPTGDDYVRVAHARLYTTNPLNQDTDFDGIPDGRELLIGTNPNTKDAANVIDSDGDGLFDIEEDTGWLVTVWPGGVGFPTVTRRFSNKFRADTDGDGIPDALEWAIKGDPSNTDTDGDGLFDRDEFDPDDTERYYDQATLADGFRRCAAAEHCAYTNPEPALADRLRTNVWKVNSDADTLSDFQEVTGSRTVAVFGGVPYSVRSKPYSGDFDLDGAHDGVEEILGTDPNKADTDEDGLGDDVESDRGRSALRVDKRVRVVLNLGGVQVNGDCEPDIDGAGEFQGQVRLDRPGPGGDVLAYELSGCAGNQGAACCASGCSGLNDTFILNQGDTFRIYSTNVIEDDGSCGPACDDEVLGSFTETFTFDALNITSRELTESGTCKLTVNWELVVD